MATLGHEQQKININAGSISATLRKVDSACPLAIGVISRAD